MTFEDLTKRLIESFNRFIFPAPLEFTDLEVEAIATIPGIDLNGTFADAPMERALMRRYDLEVDRGENTWPAFASTLREEKTLHFEYLTFERQFAIKLRQINEAKADCRRWGISPERIIGRKMGS
jgi:hypothetical protein